MKRVRGSIKYICMIVLCTCLFWSNSMTADAYTKYEQFRMSYPSGMKLVFDPVFYANTYPDVANNAYYGKNSDRLFEHYLEYGLREGRWGTEKFNCLYYMQNYPDIRNFYGIKNMLSYGYENYMVHYMKYGKAENRIANRVVEYQTRPDKRLMSKYTIKFNPKADAKRTDNIIQAVTLLNGLIIQPGQKFTFNNTVLFSYSKPLYHAASCDICSSKKVVGGGICYVEQAAKNAFIQAGFPLKYKGGSCNSSLAMDSNDLVVVNVSGKPILIEASMSQAAGEITVLIYYMDKF